MRLYYITHIDNLISIMKMGILSHARVEKEGIPHTPIYDRHIVGARKNKFAPDGNSLWNFANLFFNPRNPMLYRVLREKSAKDIVVIALDPILLNKEGIFITTGNAIARQSEIFTRDQVLLKIKKFQRNIRLERWSVENNSKTKIMAECLVPDRVPLEYLREVYVVNHKVANDIKARHPDLQIDIIPEPYMFFQRFWKRSIANSLGVIENRFFFIGARAKHQDLHKQGKLVKSTEEKQLLLFPVRVHWIQRGNMIGTGKG
jgi:hypothetical protein